MRLLPFPPFARPAALARSFAGPLALAACLIAAGLSPWPGQAQTPAEGPNLDPAATTAPGALARLAAAHALYRVGLADRDALAMLTAAHLARGVALVPADRAPEVTGDSPAADAAPPVPPDAAAMAEAARALTEPEETLALLWADIEAAAVTVPPRQMRATPATLAPGAAHLWRLPFDGQVLAEAGVIGAGAGLLTVTLHDDGGALLCAPQTRSDSAACAFVPRVSGYVSLRVENPGDAAVAYYLVTN